MHIKKKYNVIVPNSRNFRVHFTYSIFYLHSLLLNCSNVIFTYITNLQMGNLYMIHFNDLRIYELFFFSYVSTISPKSLI